MTLKKISDHIRCMNPEHDPPMHIVLSPGVWEHTCPGCGQTTVFHVDAPMWTSPYSPYKVVDPVVPYWTSTETGKSWIESAQELEESHPGRWSGAAAHA